VETGEIFALHVEARDQNGDPDGAFSADIQLALVDGAAGSLTGTTARKVEADGIARFEDLAITEIGSFRIAASGGAATPDTSGTVTVESSGATALEFQQPPTSAEAGSILSPSVTVRAVDGSGATDPAFTGSVTLAIGTNPGGGVLAGTTTVTAVAGVATFSDLSINRVGTGYTLVASASGLTDATSASFDVSVGPASGVLTTIAADPTSLPADGATGSAITVEVFDAQGNPRTAGGDTVELSTTAGALGVVADNADGTYTAVLVAPSDPGQATVSGTVNGLVITDTATVTFTEVVPVATGLAFGQEPSNTAVGASIAPAVTVRGVDDQGVTVASFTGDVTVAIGTNPGGGGLSGTLTVAAVGGVATFADLSIDQTGDGYTLTADADALTGATSAPFSIGPGPASGATTTIDAVPDSVPADGTSTATVTVAVFDALGNPRSAGGDLVALSTTAGALGPVSDHADGTYSASLTAPSAAAVATVSGTVEGLAITDTATVTFTAVEPIPSALEFDQEPSTTVAGGAVTPAVSVRVVDDSGVPAPSFTGDVTVAIGTNPAAGTLAGTTTVAAVAGVATFPDLSIDRAGSGYTLTASATGLAGAASAPFSVTPGPASTATTTITAAPTSIPADGSSASVILVETFDAFGNRRAVGGDAVALATTQGTLGPVTDRGDGSYTATLTAPSAPGTATVTGTIGGLAIADDADVEFTPIPPTTTRLVFQQQPTDAVAGAALSPPVIVRAVDNAGTTVVTFAGSVTIGIGANPAAGSLSGTTTVSAVAGIATFTDLSIDQAGSGYTLAATSAGLSGATSLPFAVTPGPASGLTTTIAAVPGSLVADGASTSAVTVQVRDGFGNLRTAGGDAVALTTTVGALGSVVDNGDGTYGAVLVAPFTPGTAIVTGTVNGAAIDDTATVVFGATAPAAVALAFGQQPTTTVAGAAISPPVTVHAIDGSGATDGSFTGPITLSIATNPGGGVLRGTRTVSAVNGVATFLDLSIDRAGSGYTLSAIAPGLTDATSAGFSVTTGPASAATTTISASPTSIPADGTSTSIITVEVLDELGNRRTGGDVVTLSTTAGTLGPVTDLGDGTRTATLTASSTPALATISGTVNGSAIVDTAAVTFAAAGADLAVSVEADDLSPALGETVVYSIRVINQGPGPANGVEVTYEIDDRQSFLSAESSQGTYDPQAGVWTVGSLEPGAEATLTVAVQILP
jgi:adhesin/invasin